LLLVLAWRAALGPHRLIRGDDPAMTWIELRPSVPEPAPPATQVDPDRAVATTPDPPRETADAGTATSQPASLPPRQIDWSANATYHARKAVEAAAVERYRNLGARRPGPPPEPEVPSLFEAKPDVAGEIGEDINGDPVLRLSEHCYQELEKPVPTARDYVDPRPLLQKCLFPIGKREPRGDLFEHLKRDRPLPQPKPGATAELPEREE
jgi:hypothetical protein